MFNVAFEDIVGKAFITTVAVYNKNCAYSEAVDAALPQSVFGIRSNAVVLYLQHKAKAWCVVWLRIQLSTFHLTCRDV